MYKNRQFLYTKRLENPKRTLFMRLAIIVALLLFATTLMWLDREGLRDSRTGERPNFVGVCYFTMVTVTTVGYGDIVPVSDFARTVDALVLTPIRFIIWFVMFGTAYQFVIRRYMEEYRMKKLQKTLRHHTIICGFGATGEAAATELLERGYNAESIIAIDPDGARCQAAADMSIVSLCGDASREAMLNNANIDEAKTIIICTGRDDTTVLTALTARDLAPDIDILAAVVNEENHKLVKRGGADAIILPSAVGGKMLAAASVEKNTINTLNDILSSSGKFMLNERKASGADVGKNPKDLETIMVIGMRRDKDVFGPGELENITIQENDILIYFKR